MHPVIKITPSFGQFIFEDTEYIEFLKNHVIPVYRLYPTSLFS